MSEAGRYSPIRRVGRILIAAGVAVWAVYGIVWLLGGDPVMRQYLPFHLVGVLPGALLSRWGAITRWWGRFRRRSEPPA